MLFYSFDFCLEKRSVPKFNLSGHSCAPKSSHMSLGKSLRYLILFLSYDLTEQEL